MGALIMVHGDDAGLRIPPRLAPVQVVVLAARTEEGAGEAASALAEQLRAAGVRVELDVGTDSSFGRRVVNWELKGVPVRVEVGPRDLAAGTVVLSWRDDKTKASLPLGGVVAAVTEVLESSQAAMFAEALRRREENTVRTLHPGGGGGGCSIGLCCCAWTSARGGRWGRTAQYRWYHGPPARTPGRISPRPW